MSAQEKRDPSVFGLGVPVGQNDPSAWRPSKVNEERLSSLSSKRARGHFRLPRGTRSLVTFVLLVGAVYVFRRMWLMPEAGDLHPALAIVAGALTLVLVAAIANALQRRRRKRGDDQSILRL